MPCDLVIFGAGGQGQEVADLARASGAWDVVGFVDDDPGRQGREVVGLPVVGDRSWLSGRKLAIAIAIGSPAGRRRTWEDLRGMGDLEAPPLVHPAAHLGLECEVGEGSIVAAGAVLTADVKGGHFALINAGATVSHNCRLADFATVAPGAHLAGNVHVGEGADIGIGACTVQGVTIGEWSVVGAGTVVISDIEANTTVVGCPARLIATRPSGWQL